jgi:hypothetical protein
MFHVLPQDRTMVNYELWRMWQELTLANSKVICHSLLEGSQEDQQTWARTARDSAPGLSEYCRAHGVQGERRGTSRRLHANRLRNFQTSASSSNFQKLSVPRPTSPYWIILEKQLALYRSSEASEGSIFESARRSAMKRSSDETCWRIVVNKNRSTPRLWQNVNNCSRKLRNVTTWNKSADITPQRLLSFWIVRGREFS